MRLLPRERRKKAPMRDKPYTTGDEAASKLTETWSDPGHGMVNVEVIEPYLRIRRGSERYTVFLSLYTDFIAHFEDGDATTRHIAEADRPDTDVPQPVWNALATALNSTSGGMYPKDGYFTVSHKPDDAPRHTTFQVALAGDEVLYGDEVVWPKEAAVNE